MDTFGDIIQAVQSDMSIGDESTFYSLDTVKLAVNRAYRKAGSLFRWPETEDAKKTSSVISQEYYDYPDNWRPDSIWKLKVDGVDYGDPLVFRDYMYEKENNFPSGREKMWATHGRQFFIYPTPATDGENNICVWGFKTVVKMTSLTDVTIFSYSTPVCNEAIVLEAGAILKNKGEQESAGQFRSMEAKQILLVEWNKMKQEVMKYQKTQTMFEVPNFFPSRGSRSTRIGDF